jgi:hypothetical protein
MEQIKIYLLSIEFKDWAVIFATLIGPVLAVQAQKSVELFRENRKRKLYLFEQLMATRASRLSADHVRALNMIDLVFYGKTTFGFHRRSKKEQKILDSWKEYLDLLNSKPTEASFQTWSSQGEELFTNLLYDTAQDIGYKFDRVQLKRGAYLPLAHNKIEDENTELRQAAISLISGQHAMKMNVVGFPVDIEAMATNKTAMQNIGKAFENGELQVTVSK